MAFLEKTAHPPQTLPVRAQARCPMLPVLTERLAAPRAAVPPPHILTLQFWRTERVQEPWGSWKRGC